MRFFHLLVQSTEEAQQIADSLANNFSAKLQEISSMTFDEILRSTVDGIIHFGIKLVLCLAVFYVGKKALKFFSRILRKMMAKRDVDLTVSHFLLNLLRVIYWMIIGSILIYIMGIKTSTFVALFASAGLAFGMALSGTLQNFAGGIMILIFKPFRVGDFIEAQGQAGTVVDITITNTIITTPDNKTIYLPNGATSTGVVNNYSQQSTRRIEWTFSITYGDDYDKAKELFQNTLKADQRILPEPEPFIALKELGAHGINIVVRVWVASDNFWPVYFDVNEKIYKALPEAEVSVPFNHLDVHVYQPEGLQNKK